jgi:hypothetical protein
MNNQPNDDGLGLDNLEFFENFATDEPIESQFNPNANLAPDILNGGKLELEDGDLPTDDDDDDEKKKAPVTTPDEEEDEPPVIPQEEEETEELDEALEDDDEINYYEAFGKGLLRSGHFDLGEEVNPDEIEWTEESFIDMMNTTIENKAWKQLEDIAVEAYGQEGLELIKDLFINKVPIQSYLSKYNESVELENVDMSDPRNQEAVFREYLYRTGLDEDEVEEQLEYAQKTGKLISFSEKYYTKLLEKSREEREQQAEASAQRQRELEERENARQESYITTLEGAIKSGEIMGYPINQNDAAELFDYVTNKNYQLPNGQKISEFEMKLAKLRQEDPQKFLAVARLVQTDLDLTPIKKKGISEETNSIFQELQGKTKRGQKTGPRKETQVFSKYFGR